MIDELPDHQVIVCQECLLINRGIEIEFPQVRLRYDTQFHTRAVHQHRVQISISAGDAPLHRTHRLSLGCQLSRRHRPASLAQRSIEVRLQSLPGIQCRVRVGVRVAVDVQPEAVLDVIVDMHIVLDSG